MGVRDSALRLRRTSSSDPSESDGVPGGVPGGVVQQSRLGSCRGVRALLCRRTSPLVMGRWDPNTCWYFHPTDRCLILVVFSLGRSSTNSSADVVVAANFADVISAGSSSSNAFRGVVYSAEGCSSTMAGLFEHEGVVYSAEDVVTITSSAEDVVTITSSFAEVVSPNGSLSGCRGASSGNSSADFVVAAKCNSSFADVVSVSSGSPSVFGGLYSAEVPVGDRTVVHDVLTDRSERRSDGRRLN